MIGTLIIYSYQTNIHLAMGNHCQGQHKITIYLVILRTNDWVFVMRTPYSTRILNIYFVYLVKTDRYQSTYNVYMVYSFPTGITNQCSFFKIVYFFHSPKFILTIWLGYRYLVNHSLILSKNVVKSIIVECQLISDPGTRLK